MKERIKQLADQAGITETATGSHMICEEHELVKFATAIVQECADTIYRLREPHGNEQVEYALFIAEKRIRDRFGI